MKTEEILVGTYDELVEHFKSTFCEGQHKMVKVGDTCEISKDNLKIEHQLTTIKNLNEKMALGMVFYFYCTVMPSEEEPIQELKIVSKYVHIREETEKLKV